MPPTARSSILPSSAGSERQTHAVIVERWSDLVSEMYALVHEQGALYEVTHEVRDLRGEAPDVVHGPWLPSECQAALIPWHQAGWLDLVADENPPHSLAAAEWRRRARREGAYVVLAAEDARALLHDPSRWTINSADGHVMLSLNEEGARHDYSEWLALVPD